MTVFGIIVLTRCFVRRIMQSLNSKGGALRAHSSALRVLRSKTLGDRTVLGALRAHSSALRVLRSKTLGDRTVLGALRAHGSALRVLRSKTLDDRGVAGRVAPQWGKRTTAGRERGGDFPPWMWYDGRSWNSLIF